MIQKIIILVFCRLIGDFVLQSDFLANTKGSNWYHLFVHSMLYTIPFCVCFGFGWQFPILLVSHFVVDAMKARYGKINLMQDQILHYLICLIYLL